MSRFQAQTDSVLDRELTALRERLSLRENQKVAAVERLTRRQEAGVLSRIDLEPAEVERLFEILDREFSPTPALRRALASLADPKRKPPRLSWKETAA